MSMQGRCLCGKVRYRLSASPKKMYYCHCSQCRRASGSSFATNLAVAVQDFQILSGEMTIKAYESRPNKRRWFCGHCGSPIFSQVTGEAFVYLRAGTLDHDYQLRPQAHIHVGTKAPWFHIMDDLPQQQAEENVDW